MVVAFSFLQFITVVGLIAAPLVLFFVTKILKFKNISFLRCVLFLVFLAVISIILAWLLVLVVPALAKDPVLDEALWSLFSSGFLPIISSVIGIATPAVLIKVLFKEKWGNAIIASIVFMFFMSVLAGVSLVLKFIFSLLRGSFL